MTKLEERCAWKNMCIVHQNREDADHILSPSSVEKFQAPEHFIIRARWRSRKFLIKDWPCSCEFITLPKRKGSKSEMPTPEEVIKSTTPSLNIRPTRRRMLRRIG